MRIFAPDKDTVIHFPAMTDQLFFVLQPKPKGVHLITSEVMRHLEGRLPEKGLLNLFVQHTSCALTLNENADRDVRLDMADILSRLFPEDDPSLRHTLEGADDMPAHAVSALVGQSVTIPIERHRLALGTWQGLWLVESRYDGGPRRMVATILS